ncbi:glycosyl hydrolase, family 31, partial [Ostertagia ostertagi]
MSLQISTLTSIAGQPPTGSRRLSCPITGPGSEFDNPPYKTYARRCIKDQQESTCVQKPYVCLRKPADEQWTFTIRRISMGCLKPKATIQALSATTGKRGAIIISGVMEFNFFGLPYVGSDICGFNGNTTEELCVRWHQMGAFHPFCRNHNTEQGSPQDPAVWPSVAKAARLALNFRYTYLPYLYSLLYAAAVDGHTVIRPLFFEVSNRFCGYGNRSSVPMGNITSVHAYFPADVWYSLIPANYGQQMDIGYVDVEARLDSLTPVFARGKL